MSKKLQQKILEEMIDFCNRRGSRTFQLRDFSAERLPIFKEYLPNNNNVAAKIRQQIQELRKAGAVTFVDGRGTYTLRQIPLLDHEREAIQKAELSNIDDDLQALLKQPQAGRLPKPLKIPQKREHFIETYMRDTGWVRQAKKVYGEHCLVNKCNNTFLKPHGKPYIEVHHIVPLCDGGEDGVWNLSVLCAHHHRMAHYARKSERVELRNDLQKKVTKILDTKRIT